MAAMGTAVITGATSGIGLEFARQLAARGDDVVLVARDEVRLVALAAELTAAHRVRCEVLVADLSDRVQIDLVAARLADTDRPVQMLINNAGFAIKESFLRSDLETEQRLLDVFITAVMRLTHAVLPGMVASGNGSVINVSSAAGWITGSTYSAAKSWQTVFSESMAGNLGGTGVRVMVLAPGFTRTELMQRANTDFDRLPDWMWLEAPAVVSAALMDLQKGKLISVPGLQYKALSTAIRYAPRPLVRKFTGGTGRRKK